MTLEEERTHLERSHTQPEAFGPIYDAYYTVVFAYALRRLGSYDAARDIAAETFLKAFLHRSSFRVHENSILAWLYRIATNEIRMFARKARYRPSYFGELADEHGLDRHLAKLYEDERNTVEQELATNEVFVRVQRRIMKLPVRYQEVIALRYFEQKPLKEIGTILDKPEGTIKSLLSRGIEKLRKLEGKTTW